MVLVVVDSREPPEIAKRVEDLLSDAVVITKQLEVGDIHFGPLTVERKTAQDFINSWFSGHLQDQVCSMIANKKVKRPLLAVHFDNAERVASEDWNRIKKHMRTINLALPAFAFETLDDMLFFLADQVDHIHRGDWIDYVKRPVRVIENDPAKLPAAIIYAGLPGVGHELALRLAEIFPAPVDLTRAIQGVTKLDDAGKKPKPWYDAVEGIGKQKAKAIAAVWLGTSPSKPESSDPESVPEAMERPTATREAS